MSTCWPYSCVSRPLICFCVCVCFLCMDCPHPRLNMITLSKQARSGGTDFHKGFNFPCGLSCMCPFLSADLSVHFLLIFLGLCTPWKSNLLNAIGGQKDHLPNFYSRRISLGNWMDSCVRKRHSKGIRNEISNKHYLTEIFAKYLGNVLSLTIGMHLLGWGVIFL